MNTIFEEYLVYLNKAIDDEEVANLWKNDFADRMSSLVYKRENAIDEEGELYRISALVWSMQDFFNGAFDFLDTFYVTENFSAQQTAEVVNFKAKATKELFGKPRLNEAA